MLPGLKVDCIVLHLCQDSLFRNSVRLSCALPDGQGLGPRTEVQIPCLLCGAFPRSSWFHFIIGLVSKKQLNIAHTKLKETETELDRAKTTNFILSCLRPKTKKIYLKNTSRLARILLTILLYQHTTNLSAVLVQLATIITMASLLTLTMSIP